MNLKKDIIVGLVDADLLNGGTRHPNLVLLKLAGFLNDNGIKFHLIIDSNEDISKYNLIYMSKVFSFTPDPLFYKQVIGTKDEKKFRVGGTGAYAIQKDVKKFKSSRSHDMNRLESDRFLNTLRNKRGGIRKFGIDMRRQMPYYHLYDEYVDGKIAEGRKASYFNDYKYYSIGFLTRGCIRHCPFCINKLENEIYRYSELEWFLDQEKDEKGKLVRPYIYLWDDNFLAADNRIWKPMLEDLIASKRAFQFRQGLDERILAESEDGPLIAEMLSKCKYHGDFIFAFDNWRDRDKIIKALKTWKYYNPKKSTKFYLFCGYKQSEQSHDKFYRDIWELFQRIKILMSYGCVGYVMRHEDYHKAPISNFYVQIARWCNQQAFYKKMSFWEYCYRNQTYWEQHYGFEVIDEIKSFDDFQRDFDNGFYEHPDKNGKVRKICRTLRTALDVLEMFPEHYDELIQMYNYKMEGLINPDLWQGRI